MTGKITYYVSMDGEIIAVGSIDSLKAYMEDDDNFIKKEPFPRFGWWVQDWKLYDDQWIRKYTEMDDNGPFHYAEIWEVVSLDDDML